MSVTASEDALELLCCENLESDGTCRAVEDKRLLDDERVLKNMMDSEIQHMPTCNYFSCVQNDLTPRMRKILADWMLEVCEDQGCSDDVFPLSMNLVDRFLCSVTLSKSQLQLLGTVALFIASKIKETRPLSAEVLVELTDRSVSLDDVMQWELFVLNRLKWDLNAVTAHDFVDYLVRRLDPLPSGLSVEQVKAHAKTFITLCATDYTFAMCPPSMISAAALGAAVRGLCGDSPSSVLPTVYAQDVRRIQHRLQEIVAIELDVLRSCEEQIEQLVLSRVAASQASEASPPSSTQKAAPAAAATSPESTTPTDVRNVHF